MRLRTYYFVSIALCSVVQAASAHQMSQSPYHHSLGSYEGIHSQNSHPVAGREIREYRAGAAIVPESRQHVLGRVLVYSGEKGVASVDKVKVGQVDGASSAKTRKDDPGLGIKVKGEGAAPSSASTGKKRTSDDPIRAAFEKWCDLDRHDEMTEEDWEIIEKHNLPKDIDCEMK